MRVITGTAKGRRLETLAGDATRPTVERVKEGVFSAIAFEVEGRRVLDLFAGSGTTVIAAEQNERVAYVMEFDPKYADVIIDRWETFTGKKAYLLED